MKQQNSSLYIAILALIVSVVSLWLWYQNREHDRLVEFEQRKQEVRYLSLEGEMLSGKLEEVILEHVKTDKTPKLREHAANILKEVTNIRKDMNLNVKDIAALPATSNTDVRIKLETLLTNQRHINNRLREMIVNANKVDDVNINNKHGHKNILN